MQHFLQEIYKKRQGLTPEEEHVISCKKGPPRRPNYQG
jgi:hypothetical protein